jgi:hypothetical protein
LLFERTSGWPREADIGGLDALCLRIRRNKPEDRIGTRECFIDDINVAMRSLDALDALARFLCKARRVACYCANWLRTTEDMRFTGLSMLQWPPSF